MTRCTRSRALSLVSRCPTWVLAVASLMHRLAAISELDRPVAIRARTSRSRAVMAGRAPRGLAAGGAGRGGGGRRVNSATSRRVTLGASRASPAAMTRIALISSAGCVLLSRNPLAPACSAA